MPKQKLCVFAEIPGAKDQDPSQAQHYWDQGGWILVVHPHLLEQPGGPSEANQDAGESHCADAHLGERGSMHIHAVHMNMSGGLGQRQLT